MVRIRYSSLTYTDTDTDTDTNAIYCDLPCNALAEVPVRSQSLQSALAASTFFVSSGTSLLLIQIERLVCIPQKCPTARRGYKWSLLPLFDFRLGQQDYLDNAVEPEMPCRSLS